MAYIKNITILYIYSTLFQIPNRAGKHSIRQYITNASTLLCQYITNVSTLLTSVHY